MLTLAEVTRLGTRFARTVADAECRDNEFQTVFGVVVGRPLASFSPHPEEVDGLVQVPLESAAPVLAGPEMIPAEDGYHVAVLDRLGALVNGRAVTPFVVRR